MRVAKLSLLVFAVGLLGGRIASGTFAQAQWRVVGWNDLGMHCMDASYDVFAILPPFNNLHAQVIDPRGELVSSVGTVSVTYEAVADSSGSINTTSVGKTDFWLRARQLFGVSLAPDAGLAGNAMPGSGNVAQPMGYVQASRSFVAQGVPITPYDDAGNSNPYPVMRLIARDAGGGILATTDVVVPVSTEMDCRSCHASGSSAAARPPAGWVDLGDRERDYRLNILRLHDRHLGESTYGASLSAAGYRGDGLYPTVIVSDTAVLCARCHASNALGTAGVAGVPQLTTGIHGLHAAVADPATGTSLDDATNRSACYRCHPGEATRCLRGVMGNTVATDGSQAIQCQDCHGSMSAIGASSRVGWLDEPLCQSCHTGTAVRNAGALRYTTVFETPGEVRAATDPRFASDPDTPAPGLSLYRLSTGHGGMKCVACHGPTHAEVPSSHPDDNTQSLAIQGHLGALGECTACHTDVPNTVSGGPHGLHPVGQVWIEGHKEAAEDRPQLCRDCHGTDSRGTVLSRALGPRTLSAFGTRQLWRGNQVGCYLCHNGPDSDDRNRNLPPVARDASATTDVDVAVGIDLVASDSDGDPLVLRIVSQPARGSVGLVGSRATYFPEASSRGTFTFTFAAWDGSADSNLGVVVVTVGAVPTGTAVATATSVPGGVRLFAPYAAADGDLP